MDNDVDSTTSSSDSIRTTESRIVLVKLFKSKQPHMSKVQRCSTSLTFIASDEGYDDTEYPELESQCVFYPLSDNDDECMISKRDQAAVKIQAAWRGYSSRLKTGHLQFHLRPEQHVILSLVKLCDRFHRREMSTMNERLYQLEQRIREETAMRIAFEKAMEDMTVLMDQQQKVLYDRLEQEVRMRQTYEDKMNTTLTQIQPLENRITKEANARKNLEDMMTCVLDELQETKALQYKQTKEAADSKKEMQAKLDQALEEITTIKKQQLPTRPSVKASTVPRVTKTSYTSALSPATLSTASPTSITASARKSTLSGSTKTNTKHTPSPRKSVVPASKDTSRPLRSVVDSKQKRSIQSQPERPSVVPSRRPAGNATAPPSGRRPVLACK
jgi:hypothetical protein